jgi:hypothetical protein
MKSLIASALVRGARSCQLGSDHFGAAAPQAKTQSAGSSHASRFQRAPTGVTIAAPYYRPHAGLIITDAPLLSAISISSPAPFIFGIGFGPSWW